MNIDITIPLSIIKNKVREYVFSRNDTSLDSDYYYDYNLIDKAILELEKLQYAYKSKDGAVYEGNHAVEEYSNKADIPVMVNYKDVEKQAVHDLSKWVSCQANYLKRLQAGKIT